MKSIDLSVLICVLFSSPVGDAARWR